MGDWGRRVLQASQGIQARWRTARQDFYGEVTEAILLYYW